jgi:hypothetical protein
MQQTFAGVGMAEKIAPILKYFQGSFSSDLKGSGALNKDMSLDYASLQGDGKVQIPSAQIVNLPMLAKIAEVTKVKSLNNLSITNAMTILKFKDGKVAVEPTDLKFGNGYNINFQGQNGFDQTIAYDVRFDVPTTELGASNELVSKIPKVPGIDFKMPAKLNISLKVGGTVQKPTVSISKVSGDGTSAKDIAKQVLDQAKQKAEEEARKVADQAKQQAQDYAKKQAEDLLKGKANTDAINDAAQKAKDAAKKYKLPF